MLQLAAWSGLLLALLVPQDAKENAQLLKDLQGVDATAREAAFEKLSSTADAATLAKLDATLASTRGSWFRKWSGARGAAIQDLLRKMGRPNLEARREEALKRFRREDHEGMQPLVEEMWKAAYLDPAAADLVEAVSDSRTRVVEVQDWLERRGKKPDPAMDLYAAARLMDEQALILLCPPRDQGILRDNVDLRGRIRPVEYEVILTTNLYRILMGKNALKIDVKLCEAGREHSTDMRTHKFFAHQSPLEGKRTPQDRAARHKTTCSSENIAICGSARAAFWGWFHSMGHHKNMMGEWTKIGVGNCEDHWTENF